MDYFTAVIEFLFPDLVIVICTAALVCYTRGLVACGNKQNEATVLSVEHSKKPCVVPVLDVDAAITPDRIAPLCLVNVGNGPAFNVSYTVVRLQGSGIEDQDGLKRLEERCGKGTLPFNCIPSQAKMPITRVYGHPENLDVTVELRITYSDMDGKVIGDGEVCKVDVGSLMGAIANSPVTVKIANLKELCSDVKRIAGRTAKWLVPCSHCGGDYRRWNLLDEESIGREGLLCKHCGEDIHWPDGQWVST